MLEWVDMASRKGSSSSTSKRALKRRGSTKIARISTCERCLQFKEDCECCESCGGVEVHEHGCSEADTKPRLDVKRLQALAERRTLRGLAPERRMVISVPDEGEVRGDDSTGEVRALREGGTPPERRRR